MQTWTAKVKGVFEAYGPLAFGLWWVVFLSTWLGCAALIQVGFGSWFMAANEAQASSTWSIAGIFGAAYIVTRATMPGRVLLVLALTPWVARVLGREAQRPPPEGEP